MKAHGASKTTLIAGHSVFGSLLTHSGCMHAPMQAHRHKGHPMGTFLFVCIALLHLQTLHTKLLLPTNASPANAGTRYNIPVISALVLYVGVSAIQRLQAASTENPQTTVRYVPMLRGQGQGQGRGWHGPLYRCYCALIQALVPFHLFLSHGRYTQ